MQSRGIYLSEADTTRNIYIKEDPQLESLAHFHDGVEIVVIMEGEVDAFRIKQSKRLSTGDIFFADSFDCHHYKQISPTLRAIVIVLSSDYTNIFRSVYHGKTFPAFMCDTPKNEGIIKIIKEWLAEEEKPYMLNVGYCNLLFSKLLNGYELEEKTESRDKNVSVMLLKYINEHYTEDISLTLVSKTIGYTKEYCSKIFAEVVGMGFRDYLNFLRLKKAEEYFALKKGTNLTTTEIIYKCGFNSTATFYRVKNNLKNKNIKF